MAQSEKMTVDWQIKNLDRNLILRPQFPIGEDGVSISIGGNLAEQSRFGFQDPITNWTQGKARNFTFSTMLFARSAAEGIDVVDLLGQFEGLAVKDEELGRPPICLFTYGEFLSETVLVESVDPKIKNVMSNGQPQQVELSITLRKYKAFSSQRLIDPSKPAKESLYLVATDAENSYEQIARRFYGDPMLGDRLRKRHPAYPFAPNVGSVVKVPSKSVILQEVVEPSSHILSLDNEDAVFNFENILEDRNNRQLVVIK